MRKKKASSQASWSILSSGVSNARVEAHILRIAVNQMVEAIKKHPQVAEEVFRLCGDNFEAIPKHLSKLERSLDRTNYALITMGSDWYRQRLTHEDREMVDLASTFNPTPTPSTTKSAAYLKDSLMDAVVDHEEVLYAADPEFNEDISSPRATLKQEALWSGDFDTAMALAKDDDTREVLLNIKRRVLGGKTASKKSFPCPVCSRRVKKNRYNLIPNHGGCPAGSTPLSWWDRQTGQLKDKYKMSYRFIR
jgi:hypothetical protein